MHSMKNWGTKRHPNSPYSAQIRRIPHKLPLLSQSKSLARLSIRFSAWFWSQLRSPISSCSLSKSADARTPITLNTISHSSGRMSQGTRTCHKASRAGESSEGTTSNMAKRCLNRTPCQTLAVTVSHSSKPLVTRFKAAMRTHITVRPLPWTLSCSHPAWWATSDLNNNALMTTARRWESLGQAPSNQPLSSFKSRKICATSAVITKT